MPGIFIVIKNTFEIINVNEKSLSLKNTKCLRDSNTLYIKNEFTINVDKNGTKIPIIRANVSLIITTFLDDEQTFILIFL